MNRGVNRVKPQKTHYSTRTFGAAKPATYQAFSFDAGFGFPDQNADGHQNGCRIYTTLALCQDQDKNRYDMNHLALTVANDEGQVPYSAGDVEVALAAVCVDGIEKPGEQPAAKSERAHYFMLEKQPGMDWFDSAIANMLATKSPLSLAGPWFPEFENAPGGRFPSKFPATWTSGAVGHNHEGYGVSIEADEPLILDKSWQGTSWGANGEGKWDRASFNAFLDIPGAGAFLVTPWDGSVQTIQYGIIYRLEILIRLYQRLLARHIGSWLGVK